MSVGFSVPHDIFLSDRWSHLGPSEQHFMQQMHSEYLDRLVRYEAAWDAYLGKMPLPLKPTRTDKSGKDNVLVPNPTLVVDTVVANLFGQRTAPTFEVETDPEGDEPAGRSEEEKWLDLFWEASRKLILLNAAATNGGIYGHCFLRLSDPTTVTKPYPRVTVIDPQEMVVQTDPDDIEHVLEYMQCWHYVDNRGRTVWRRQRHVESETRLSWVIHDEISMSGQPGWRANAPALVWNHAWSQIHDCQHLPLPNTYFGRSELEPYMLQVAETVNFNYSNRNRILRNHGHPKTYATGFTGKELVLDPDQTVLLPSPDAKIGSIEMQSDLSGAHEHSDRVEDLFFRVARVPRIALGTVGESSNLSAVALAVRFRPLEDKIGVLRLLYGDLLARLNRHALELGAFGADQRVKNVWPQLLPKDALVERQVAEMDQRLGVSQDTTLTQLGYDAAREKVRKDKEGFAMAPGTPGARGPAGVSGRPDVSPQPRRPSV